MRGQERRKLISPSPARQDGRYASLPTGQDGAFPVLEGEDALRFLVDAGVLFRINHRDLHPAGFRLEMRTRRGKKFPVVVDLRRRPELCVYTNEQLASGNAKVASFHRDSSTMHARHLRRRLLGYEIQPIPASHTSDVGWSTTAG